MEPRGATASYDAANDSYLSALLLAERARLARRAGADPGRSQGAPARHHRGCRRRVRAQDRPLPGIPRDPGGGAQARPPGALDVEPRRGVPQRQPCPRRLQRRRARARRARQNPGAARAPPRQHGRLYRRRRRQHPDRQSHALPARHVRHQADRPGRALRVHQHHDHGALSRRRAAGGEFHPRARDRRGRARDRHRSGEAAPAQPDQAQGDAVQDRDRHHHRQRRVRDRARQGAGARRLRRLQAAPARGGETRQVSRARHFLHAGARRRLPARGHRAEISRRREADLEPQRAIDRARPRHHLQSDAGGAARHQARADPAPARRFGDGDRRLCLGRLALGDDREPRHDQDRRGAARQGQGDRRDGAGNGGSRHRVSRRKLQRRRDRPQASRCSISPPAPRR